MITLNVALCNAVESNKSVGARAEIIFLVLFYFCIKFHTSKVKIEINSI